MHEEPVQEQETQADHGQAGEDEVENRQQLEVLGINLALVAHQGGEIGHGEGVQPAARMGRGQLHCTP